MPQMLEVNADLVGASGVKRAFHERAAAEFLKDAVFGFRRATAGGFDHRHFFAMHGMSPDGSLDDPAFPFKNPGGEREVYF